MSVYIFRIVTAHVYVYLCLSVFIMNCDTPSVACSYRLSILGNNHDFVDKQSWELETIDIYHRIEENASGYGSGWQMGEKRLTLLDNADSFLNEYKCNRNGVNLSNLFNKII